ncbi:MAG: endonuclease MutS2 [Lachnospiraceae bacterium]
MNKKALQTLEYNKILDVLQGFACSSLAKDRCAHLKPSGDPDKINQLLEQTSAALSRILAHGSISFQGIFDLRPYVKRLEAGGVLSISELLSVSSTLSCASRALNYNGDTQSPDCITPLFESLNPLGAINSEIKNCIIGEDEISDDASPNLRDIRRQIRLTNDKIHSELTRMVNSQTTRTYLQEAVITSRQGRYCIPVKAEYKSSVPGMVHDQSATGSTFFIEPMSVVMLNNTIRELQIKEQEEIQVILARLSAMCAENTESLLATGKALVELDFIFARALLSKHWKCSCPDMNSDGVINLKKARHPLIPANQVVPIDISLGDTFDLLIVTGPNTGGKTVSLKTVGLLTLMGQSGLHIPAFDHSKLAIFSQIYADIGDEQSIEQSLSTFSSHMVNTVNILKNCDENSLVLFDEIGAGTDPIEGAALAVSILSWLHGRGIRTMATTHYSELKVFALSTPGVENASCEFDVETLSPTYRLLIGIPGKSNAFAISGKLGLPAHIIEDAGSRIDSSNVKFEDLLADLEDKRKIIEKEHEEIAGYKLEVEKLRQELQRKSENLDERSDKILREARQEAAEILRNAKEVADETISAMNKHGLSVRELEKDRTRVREEMNKVNSGLKIKTPVNTPKKKHKPSEFKLGVKVKVLSMNLTGTVNSLPNAKGDLFVQMGIMRSQVNISDLEIIDEDVTKEKNFKATGAGRIKMSKSATISPELNLLGLTADEAIQELDKYLDDAYLSKLGQVRIVHGKGTGVLRNAVQSYLKGVSYVKSYRLGGLGEGDTGVTIVEFK